jgi:hypothetical protein
MTAQEGRNKETIKEHEVQTFSLEQSQKQVAEGYMKKSHLSHEEARSLLFYATKEIPKLQLKKAVGGAVATVSTVMDAGEGAGMAAITMGASEAIPVTEIAVDMLTKKLAETCGIKVSMVDQVLAYSASLIPVVGDFISPGNIAGVREMIMSDVETFKAVAMIVKAGYSLMKAESPQTSQEANQQVMMDQTPAQAMINQRGNVPTSLMNGEKVGTKDNRVPEQAQSNYSTMPLAA